MISLLQSGIKQNVAAKNVTGNAQRGFTLVELMVASTISLIILLVIGTVFVSSRGAFRMQDDTALIQESGRFALEVIGRSVKRAGSGYVNLLFDEHRRNHFAVVDFTGTAISGTDGGAGVADTLTLQYDGVVGDRDCAGGVIKAVTATAAVLAGLTIKVQDHFNLDAANAQLQCAGSISAAGAASPLPAAPPSGQVLLENVEDFQVLYGFTDVPGSQSANRYSAVPVAPATWDDVITARVCVLIRSSQANIVAAGSSYRDCNGANVVVPADRRLRRAFFATFSLRNRVSEMPELP